MPRRATPVPTWVTIRCMDRKYERRRRRRRLIDNARRKVHNCLVPGRKDYRLRRVLVHARHRDPEERAVAMAALRQQWRARNRERVMLTLTLVGTICSVIAATCATWALVS